MTIVAGRDHLADRQPRDIAHRVFEELDRGGAGPGALHRDVLAVVAHQFADARRAVDVRDDLDHEVRPRQALQDRRRIELAVLVAHCRRHAEHRAVMQRADESLAFVRDLRTGQLLGKAPDLASAGDRRIVIEVHGVHVAAFLHRAVRPPEAHRDDLAGLGVVAETGGIRHADELIGDRVGRHLERFRHHRSQCVRIRAVGDDHEFAVVELVRPPRISGIVERHREGFFANLGELHEPCLLIGDGVDARTLRSAIELLAALDGEIEGEHAVASVRALEHLGVTQRANRVVVAGAPVLLHGQP